MVYFEVPILSISEWPSPFHPHVGLDRVIPSHLPCSLFLSPSHSVISSISQYAISAWRQQHSSLTFSFADDMIIFVNGHKQFIRWVLNCLEHHEGVFGQLVNRDKSSLIPRRTLDTQIRRLVSLIGFTHQQQPFAYLGVLLFKEAKRNLYILVSS